MQIRVQPPFSGHFEHAGNACVPLSLCLALPINLSIYLSSYLVLSILWSVYLALSVYLSRCVDCSCVSFSLLCHPLRACSFAEVRYEDPLYAEKKDGFNPDAPPAVRLSLFLCESVFTSSLFRGFSSVLSSFLTPPPHFSVLPQLFHSKSLHRRENEELCSQAARGTLDWKEEEERGEGVLLVKGLGFILTFHSSFELRKCG